MEYELFFWTRTESIDYRYQIFPARVSRIVAEKLEAIIYSVYNDLNRQKERFSEVNIHATYSLSFENDLVLMWARPSPNRKDMSATPIWEFMGIIVNKQEENEFKSGLSAIWDSEILWKQAMEYLGRRTSTSPCPSPIIKLQNKEESSSMLWNDFIEMTFLFINQIPEISNTQVILPFNLDGEIVVKHLLTCQGLPWLSISFGPHTDRFSDPTRDCKIKARVGVNKLQLEPKTQYSSQRAIELNNASFPEKKSGISSKLPQSKFSQAEDKAREQSEKNDNEISATPMELSTEQQYRKVDHIASSALERIFNHFGYYRGGKDVE